MSAQAVPDEAGFSRAERLEDPDARHLPRQESAAPVRENNDELDAAPAVPRDGPREAAPVVPRAAHQGRPGRGSLPVANPIDTSDVPVAAPVPATDGHDLAPVAGVTDADQLRKLRRLRAGAAIMVTLLLLLMLAVGLAVGLSVSKPSASRTLRPSPAPTRGIPTTSPTATASPTRDYCRSWYGALNECVGHNGSGTSECERCIVSYFSDVLNVDLSNALTIICTEVDDETCDALDSCSDSCLNCTREVVTYVNCQSICHFGGYSCSGELT
jgi:hypothetical protein